MNSVKLTITLLNCILLTATIKAESSPNPSAGSTNITAIFHDCSSQCHNDLTCVGIAIFQQFSDKKKNETIAESDGFNEFFWCKTNLTDSPEDLVKGQVVFKIMFRDKLKKVERPIPSKKTRVRARRQTMSVNNGTVTMTQKEGSQMVVQRVPNRVALVPPQKTLEIQVPSTPQAQVEETSPRVTLLPGELDDRVTVSAPLTPVETIISPVAPIPTQTVGILNVAPSSGVIPPAPALIGAETTENSLIDTRINLGGNSNETAFAGPIDKLVIDIFPILLKEKEADSVIQFPGPSSAFASSSSSGSEEVKPSSLLIENGEVKTGHGLGACQDIQNQVTRLKLLLGNTMTSMTELLAMLSLSNSDLNLIPGQSPGSVQSSSNEPPLNFVEGQTIVSIPSNDSVINLIQGQTIMSMQLPNNSSTVALIQSPNVGSSSTSEPLPSEQLEGVHIDNSESTEIPTPEVEMITIAPFPFLRPTSGGIAAVVSESSVPIGVIEQEDVDTDCVFSDREKFKRNILATSYALLFNEPTMLTFVNDSTCVGAFSKSGTKLVMSINKIFPDLPPQNRIMAGAYLQNGVYLFDQDQIVWTFIYNQHLGTYTATPARTMTKEAFLTTKCGFNLQDMGNIYVKAIAQISQQDGSCIIFDKSGGIFLSSNSSQEAMELMEAISFMMKTEFVDYVESVFGWLDENFMTKIFVFGSNGEVYEFYRDSSTQFKWQRGAYRIIPYENFPYENFHQTSRLVNSQEIFSYR